MVAVEVDEATGEEKEVMGFAHWQKPGPEQPEVLGVEVRPATFDRGMFLKVVEAFTAKDKEALGEKGHEDYWCEYLPLWEEIWDGNGLRAWTDWDEKKTDAILISVDPKHHRKGLGKKLVNWGLEFAKKEGRDAYLTATEAGKPLYELCGFEALETYDCYGQPLTSMVWRLEKNKQ